MAAVDLTQLRELVDTYAAATRDYARECRHLGETEQRHEIARSEAWYRSNDDRVSIRDAEADFATRISRGELARTRGEVKALTAERESIRERIMVELAILTAGVTAGVEVSS